MLLINDRLDIELYNHWQMNEGCLKTAPRARVDSDRKDTKLFVSGAVGVIWLFLMQPRSPSDGLWPWRPSVRPRVIPWLGQALLW